MSTCRDLLGWRLKVTGGGGRKEDGPKEELDCDVKQDPSQSCGKFCSSHVPPEFSQTGAKGPDLFGPAAPSRQMQAAPGGAVTSAEVAFRPREVSEKRG